MFFKRYWNLVGNDIFSMFCFIGHFDPTIFETLIILIPKVENPTTWAYQPLNHCQQDHQKSLYQPPLILTWYSYCLFQNSFLPRIGFSNNAIILQETVHTVHNNVSWDLTWIMPLVISVKSFLDHASQTLGSYRSLSNLSCTLSYFSHYLWNKNILYFFKPSRDLLKGDPPSPCIFIISMGKLSNITYDFVRNDSWKSICFF